MSTHNLGFYEDLTKKLSSSYHQISKTYLFFCRVMKKNFRYSRSAGRRHCGRQVHEHGTAPGSKDALHDSPGEP